MAKPTGSTCAPNLRAAETPCAKSNQRAKPTTRTRTAAGKTSSKTSVSAQWRGDFLAALAETSNVTAAAAAAAINPSRAYKSKRTEPDFARLWREALCEGYDNLEMELLHRLRFGETRDLVAKFDNANALRLLTQHRETVARQRAIRENADIADVRASIHAKLLDMRDQVLARRKSDILVSDPDALHG